MQSQFSLFNDPLEQPAHPPKRQPSEAETAWAAGFLEGEGCFGWYGGTTRRSQNKSHLIRTPNAVITATQNEREPLDKLVAIFNAGRINTKVNSKRTAWEWRCQGHAAIPVMQAILPYMSERRTGRIRHVITQHSLLQEHIASQKESAMCPKGHPWAQHSGFRANGRRYCKACSRYYANRHHKKKKARKKGGEEAG